MQTKEESIARVLSNFSEKLSETKNQEEKLKILVEFDEFLKNNRDIIKKRCPNLLVSILNSL